MSNVNAIYNFIQVSENLATAGHPTAEQIPSIAATNYQTVINLAPSDVSQAIPNEAELVRAAGMEYLHIPVAWNNPDLADWEAFVSAMEANKDKKVFVHCQANMRVSAFVMLYRHIKLGIDLETAQSPMLSIWNPEAGHPKWAYFIEDVLDKENK